MSFSPYFLLCQRASNEEQRQPEEPAAPEYHSKEDPSGGSLSNEKETNVGAVEAGYIDKAGDLIDTADGEVPTDHEKRTLRHVPENLPVSAWLVAVVELCERFTYYGMSGLFQNYIQRPLDGSKGRGALGELCPLKSKM